MGCARLQLHAAVVELSAGANAEIKYSTVQNWYAGNEEGVGGIYNFVTKRGLCHGARSKISWTQARAPSQGPRVCFIGLQAWEPLSTGCATMCAPRSPVAQARPPSQGSGNWGYTRMVHQAMAGAGGQVRSLLYSEGAASGPSSWHPSGALQNIIPWNPNAQVETGSAITWKYPSVVLVGEGSVGEFYSVALTNNHQQVACRLCQILLCKAARPCPSAGSNACMRIAGTMPSHSAMFRVNQPLNPKVSCAGRHWLQDDPRRFLQCLVSQPLTPENIVRRRIRAPR